MGALNVGSEATSLSVSADQKGALVFDVLRLRQ
jgi:hypothetical protein